MGRFRWFVARKGATPDVVRRYSHLTKLYQFVLRNPSMFKGRALTLYRNEIPVLDIDFDFIDFRAHLELSEKEERGLINRAAEESRHGVKSNKAFLLLRGTERGGV